MKKKLVTVDDAPDLPSALAFVTSLWLAALQADQRRQLTASLSEAVASGEIANPDDAMAILDESAKVDVAARADFEQRIRAWTQTSTKPLRFTLEVPAAGSASPGYTLQ